MSGKLRYWSFAVLLAAGVMAAVSALVAQAADAQMQSRAGQAAGAQMQSRAGQAADAQMRRAGQGAPAMPDARGPDERREPMFLDGRSSRLGVMVQDLDGADKSGGVRVDSVGLGSPAEKAGLAPGDVVVEFDGERVRSARQFTRLVQETPEGRQVGLAILRDGKRQSLTATPEARASAWNMHIDGDRIRREVERGVDGLRGFSMAEPAMRFNFDRDFGGMFVPSSRRLGVSVDSLSDQLAQYFGASDGGALVTSVEKGSAAEKSGLKAGDVITSINGERVRDAAQVGDKVRIVREGELTIGYLRDKKAGTAKATIEARPSRGATPAEPRRPVRPAVFMLPA